MKISNPIAVQGEEIATNHLKSKGYKIVERNFRKSYGEIDIIALKDNTLIFIEVKTKTSNYNGTPLEQIHFFKLKTLVKTAQFYKSLNPNLPDALRIDAVSILLDNNNNPVSIEHVENITS